MAVSPPVCEFGWKAIEFDLPATDGKRYSLSDISGPKGTLVMFICNHCPYVLSILEQIIRDARNLQKHGIGVVAICSNDAQAYPDDSFPRMAEMAQAHSFPFLYLHDESQDVARDWGAACTPDFFGFNVKKELQYRGRLDASGRSAVHVDTKRELFEAMVQIAETGKGPSDQIASMGCSIKWR